MWVLGIKSCPHTCRASKFSDRAILLSSIHSLDEGKQAKEDTTPHLVQSHGLTPNCLSRTGAVPRRGTCAKRIPEESVSKSHQNPSQLYGETAPQVIPEQTSSFCIARADPKGNGWVQSRHPLFSFFNLRPGEKCVWGPNRILQNLYPAPTPNNPWNPTLGRPWLQPPPECRGRALSRDNLGDKTTNTFLLWSWR